MVGVVRLFTFLVLSFTEDNVKPSWGSSLANVGLSVLDSEVNNNTATQIGVAFQVVRPVIMHIIIIIDLVLISLT